MIYALTNYVYYVNGNTHFISFFSFTVKSSYVLLTLTWQQQML